MQTGGPEGEIIMCFELTDEEIEKLKQTKRIYYARWTFGQQCHECQAKQGFQPMRLFLSLDEGLELLPT